MFSQTLNINLSATGSDFISSVSDAQIAPPETAPSTREDDKLCEDSATESETESDREAMREIVRKQTARVPARNHQPLSPGQSRNIRTPPKSRLQDNKKLESTPARSSEAKNVSWIYVPPFFQCLNAFALGIETETAV